MPSVPIPSAVAPSRARWWKLIDWRLVAAVGLPLWAFVFGLVVARKPARAVAAGPPPAEAPSVVVPPLPPPPDVSPPPREVARPQPPARPEVVAVPVVVPVSVSDEPVAAEAPEFKLPDTELLAPPGQRCKTFGTKVRFHPDLPEAVVEARKARKMVFVLHISGHFEDPGFT